MASESTQNHQQNKGESQSSERSHHHVPPSGNHNYPGAGYPPTMGYPPTVGYPPPQGQYSGYPPSGYYPYSQASPPPPPGTANYHATVHQQQEYQRSTGFLRCFLIMIMFVIIFMFTTTIISWLVLRPQIPVFHVDNFSVSNFNATLPTFTANWEANVTVRNPNSRLNIDFGQIQNFVFYDEEYLLASAISQPFSLETKKSNVIHAKLSANNKDNLVEKWVVDQLTKERNKGTASFNFRMVFWTTFKSGLMWKRHLRMKVLCEDIQVTFVGASDDGNIAANGQYGNCLVLA